MTDDRDFPPIDSEHARMALSVVYQAIRTAIDLNAQLAVQVDQTSNEEAHRLHDAVFVTLNDAKQRLDALIGGLS